MIFHLLQEWERGIVRVQLRTWCKPPQGWIKVNVDEACRVGVHYFTILVPSVWFEMNTANFWEQEQTRLRPDAREAEAWSFKEALLWTKKWRTNRCIFELDAKSVVDAIHGPPKKSFFHTIIEECVGWFVSTNCLFFVWSHEVVPCFICKLILLKRSNAREIV